MSKTKASVSQLDKERLLAWLQDKTSAKTSLVAAIYSGLNDRIKRGDFDTTNEQGGQDG